MIRFKAVCSSLMVLPILILAGCSEETKTLVDFTQYHADESHQLIVDNGQWVSVKHGNAFLLKPGGLLLPSEKAWALIRYSEPYRTGNTGDALNVSVEFTFDQVADVKNQELLRVGFSNGESKLLTSFYRQGWGDYNFIGRKGYLLGETFHSQEIGLKNNADSGMSDVLRLTMSLVRAEEGKWDMVVLLQNLDPDNTVEKCYVAKDLSFQQGSSDELFAVIQNGADDISAGVANRVISRFEVNNNEPYIIDRFKSEIDFVSFFEPMESQAPLVSEGIWGAKNVLPRDTANGLGDPTLKNWCYWDGRIVKDEKGKYHIYGSRWSQTLQHGRAWKEDSKGVHAISNNPLGPYKDLGLIYPHWKGGKGSNVIGVRMHDGRYAVVTSEITKGEIFVSDSPYGPFELLGEIKVDYNGFDPGLAAYQGGKGNMSNVQIILRPDGRYMLVPRSTCVMISDSGILGPYKIMADRVYKSRPELPQHRNEDPTVWYSDGLYYIMYNHWPSKTCHYFTSADGINDWTYRGIAYKKGESKIFRYTDGTENKWEFIERPTAYVENGYVTHFIFSVLDVGKGQDLGNDNHGSKIVVVPFDGEAFAKQMAEVVKEERSGIQE